MQPPSTLNKDNWPPNYVSVWQWRQSQVLKIRGNPTLIMGAKEYYRTRPAEFINHFVDTYDPRNAGRGTPSRIPLICFQRQDDLIDFLMSCIKDEEGGLIEKARDMGATWVCAGFSVWLWLFWPGASIGWGSRKEQLVDRLGDADSIFEKMRMIIRGLPKFFIPAGFSEKDHMTYMKFINPANDATITGEGGDNIGRGGRKLIYFKDEAQPLTAKILTPDGWSTMGAMRIGSKVIGADGRARKVAHINDAGIHPVYRITFGDGTSTECSANHLWSVKKAIGKSQDLILRAHEIAAGFKYQSPRGQIQYKYRLPVCEPVVFSDRSPLPLDPYIVGVLLGDGSIKHVPKHRPKFTSIDREIVDEVARLLPADCRVVPAKDGINYRLGDADGRRGKGMVSRMSLRIMAAGIAGHGSETKFIPDDYKFASVEDRLSVLQGLMDTDGSASSQSTTFHSCSRKLADDVQFIVQSLGGTASITTKPDHRGYRDIYVVYVNLPARFVPFRLTRKINKIVPRKREMGRAIVSVELLEEMPVRCITVDADDGLYLTDHCIVTHNSAHYERPEKIEAALADNTRVPIDISSVNGMGNVFHRRRENGQEWAPGVEMEKGRTRVFVMDWRDHPAKNQEWYDMRKKKAEADGLLHVFAQEVDRNYSASVLGVVIPADWVEAAVDSHIKLGIEITGAWGAALDVADGGNDRNALAKRRGILLNHAEQWGERDTGVTTRRAVQGCKDHGPIALQYDCIGVGSGVKAEANRLGDEGLLPDGMAFVPWNAGAGVLDPDERMIPDDEESPFNKDFFANLKAQAWWELRLRFYRTFKMVTEGDVYPADDLISLDSSLPLLQTIKKELSQATMTNTGARLKLVIDKAPGGTKSPNLADAIAMAYWPLPADDSPAGILIPQHLLKMQR